MQSIFNEHARKRGYVRLLITSPVIYGMVVPLLLIDACTSFYQFVCFPGYGIPLVPRKKYVQIFIRGGTLPFLDRFNCLYCSYANGVCAYMRAVLIETEKYWCPIKYRARAGFVPPHPQAAYAEDGDLDALQKVVQKAPYGPQGKA